MNSAPTSSARGLASYKSTRERMNYAPTQSNHNPSARGWPPTNAPCRRPPFMPGTGARAKHRADSLQHTSCRSSPRERMNYARNHNPSARGGPPTKAPCRYSPFMPGTGARANELRSNPIKTQPFGQGLASYKSTRRSSPFMLGTGARAKHRADSLQHTSCRSSPRERMNYAPSHNPSARGWPPTKAPCRRSPFMPGTGARANELRA
jgi:hypothetical protein